MTEKCVVCDNVIPEGRQVCPSCDKRLDECIDHFETIATFGRIEGKYGGLNGEVAEYLKRLKYYEAAISAGRLVWKEE